METPNLTDTRLQHQENKRKGARSGETPETHSRLGVQLQMTASRCLVKFGVFPLFIRNDLGHHLHTGL